MKKIIVFINNLLFKFKGMARAIFYIGSSDALPPPLTRDEEDDLINKLLIGNDDDIRTVLIERNLRLVVYIAKKFENTGIMVEDLISVGTIGLIKAVNTFNPDKKIKLATYASRCIENEILMYIRANKKHNKDIYLQDTVGIDKDGNEVTLEDKIADDSMSIDEQVNLNIQSKILYQKIKEILKGREKTIIELRYGLINGEELTQRDIAKRLGISRSYVSRIEKRALEKLHKEME